jgi:hypothetical protein
MSKRDELIADRLGNAGATFCSFNAEPCVVLGYKVEEEDKVQLVASVFGPCKKKEGLVKILAEALAAIDRDNLETYLFPTKTK